MGDYVAPGVFVEESSFRSRTIEGVRTDIAGLIGPLRRGPLRGAPVAVRSVGEFAEVFGDAAPLEFKSGAQVNYVAHAARLFFANGGRELRVVRVARAALAAERSLPGAAGRFVARDPGAAGAYHLEFLWRAGPTATASRFDLVVRSGGPDGAVQCTIADLDLEPTGARHPSRVLARRAPDGSRLAPAGLLPIVHEPPRGSAPWPDANAFAAALRAVCDPALAAARSPRFVCSLAGGSDGEIPGAVDYAGASDPARGSSGYAALAEATEVALVAAPAAAAAPEVEALVNLLRSHCRDAGGRLAIVDAPRDLALAELRHRRAAIDDDRLAAWHPWAIAADPAQPGGELPLPPSCFLPGICARVDLQRGVHQPPANEPLAGAVRVDFEIGPTEREALLAESINVLRTLPDGRVVAWGARTLSANPELRYVSVRRLLLFLARSIEEGTQWVVFERNGPELWAALRATIEDFLTSQWRAGALLGSKAEEAFFVRCDRTTMTQDDLDHGRLVVLVGVAPVKPAEFVIFRVGQHVRDPP